MFSILSFSSLGWIQTMELMVITQLVYYTATTAVMDSNHDDTWTEFSTLKQCFTGLSCLLDQKMNVVYSVRTQPVVLVKNHMVSSGKELLLKGKAQYS